jgi:hypothetical protein
LRDYSFYESIKSKESKAPDREDVVGKFLPVLLFNDDSVGFYARKSSCLVAFLLPLFIGCLGSDVMAVLRFICHGIEWCVDKGVLKESSQKTVRK